MMCDVKLEPLSSVDEGGAGATKQVENNGVFGVVNNFHPSLQQQQQFSAVDSGQGAVMTDCSSIDAPHGQVIIRNSNGHHVVGMDVAPSSDVRPAPAQKDGCALSFPPRQSVCEAYDFYSDRRNLAAFPGYGQEAASANQQPPTPHLLQHLMNGPTIIVRNKLHQPHMNGMVYPDSAGGDLCRGFASAAAPSLAPSQYQNDHSYNASGGNRQPYSSDPFEHGSESDSKNVDLTSSVCSSSDLLLSPSDATAAATNSRYSNSNSQHNYASPGGSGFRGGGDLAASLSKSTPPDRNNLAWGTTGAPFSGTPASISPDGRIDRADGLGMTVAGQAAGHLERSFGRNNFGENDLDSFLRQRMNLGGLPATAVDGTAQQDQSTAGTDAEVQLGFPASLDVPNFEPLDRDGGDDSMHSYSGYDLGNGSSGAMDQSYDSLMSSSFYSSLEPEPRNFMCDICGKAFCKPSHLTRHRMIHTAVRQFKCIYCDKDFYRRDKFNEHVKMHLRKKCKVCNVMFPKKQDLAKHITDSGHEQPPTPPPPPPPPPVQKIYPMASDPAAQNFLNAIVPFGSSQPSGGSFPTTTSTTTAAGEIVGNAAEALSDVYITPGGRLVAPGMPFHGQVIDLADAAKSDDDVGCDQQSRDAKALLQQFCETTEKSEKLQIMSELVKSAKLLATSSCQKSFASVNSVGGSNGILKDQLGNGIYSGEGGMIKNNSDSNFESNLYGDSKSRELLASLVVPRSTHESISGSVPYGGEDSTDSHERSNDNIVDDPQGAAAGFYDYLNSAMASAVPGMRYSTPSDMEVNGGSESPFNTRTPSQQPSRQFIDECPRSRPASAANILDAEMKFEDAVRCGEINNDSGSPSRDKNGLNNAEELATSFDSSTDFVDSIGDSQAVLIREGDDMTIIRKAPADYNGVGGNSMMMRGFRQNFRPDSSPEKTEIFGQSSVSSGENVEKSMVDGKDLEISGTPTSPVKDSQKHSPNNSLTLPHSSIIPQQKRKRKEAIPRRLCVKMEEGAETGDAGRGCNSVPADDARQDSAGFDADRGRQFDTYGATRELDGDDPTVNYAESDGSPDKTAGNSETHHQFLSRYRKRQMLGSLGMGKGAFGGATNWQRRAALMEQQRKLETEKREFPPSSMGMITDDDRRGDHISGERSLGASGAAVDLNKGAPSGLDVTNKSSPPNGNLSCQGACVRCCGAQKTAGILESRIAKLEAALSFVRGEFRAWKLKMQNSRCAAGDTKPATDPPKRKVRGPYKKHKLTSAASAYRLYSGAASSSAHSRSMGVSAGVRYNPVWSNARTTSVISDNRKKLFNSNQNPNFLNAGNGMAAAISVHSPITGNTLTNSGSILQTFGQEFGLNASPSVLLNQAVAQELSNRNNNSPSRGSQHPFSSIASENQLVASLIAAGATPSGSSGSPGSSFQPPPAIATAATASSRGLFVPPAAVDCANDGARQIGDFGGATNLNNSTNLSRGLLDGDGIVQMTAELVGFTGINNPIDGNFLQPVNPVGGSGFLPSAESQSSVSQLVLQPGGNSLPPDHKTPLTFGTASMETHQSSYDSTLNHCEALE